jgi:hypothetical protein
MPTVEVAIAETVMVPETVAPFVGDVITVAMPVILHGKPVGMMVYTVDPVLCMMVVLATPDVQLVVTIPPPELVATERPIAADVSEKLPPVVLDSVTATLVAFMVRPSAEEPTTMVNVLLGAERWIFVLLA